MEMVKHYLAASMTIVVLFATVTCIELRGASDQTTTARGVILRGWSKGTFLP